MSTLTTRPSSTVSTGGAVITGGTGTFHGVTSDDSDASYATLAAGGSATLHLTDMAFGTGIVKQVRVKVRHRTASSTGAIQAHVRSGSINVASINTANSTTTIATTTGPYATAVATQAMVDAFRLVVNNISGVDIRFVELYVDYLVAAIPVVDVFEPTGTVTVSQAVVSWTYTQGSDGGPQYRYQVKVFDAATAGGGGFSPDTSTALYDSGVLSAGVTTYRTPALPDGINHRAYVRVAQLIGATEQWSAWDFSTFTTDTTAPVVQTVTPVANHSAGSITVTVTRNGAAASWTAVEVERSYDSGTTWEFVRGASEITATNLFATYAANTVVVTDYEVPEQQAVIYRARAANTDGTIVGDWTSSSSTSWSSGAMWLKSITTPTTNMTVDIVEKPVLTRNRRQGVFPVLDRRSPVVVSDVLQLATGTVTFQTYTTQQAAALAVILLQSVHLLQFPSTADVDDMWVSFGAITETFLSPMMGDVTRQWETSFTQVDRPPDSVT